MSSLRISKKASRQRSSLEHQLTKQKAVNKRLRVRHRLTAVRHYEKNATISLFRELARIAEIGAGDEQ